MIQVTGRTGASLLLMGLRLHLVLVFNQRDQNFELGGVLTLSVSLVRPHQGRIKRDEHVDDYDRDYPKSSSRSGWNSRDYYESDHSRRDYEHQSREYPRGVDKYSPDRSDNLGHRSRDKDKDLSSDRAGSGRRYTSIETKELNGEKYSRDENKRFDDRDNYKERHSEEPDEHCEDRKALSSKEQESVAKKPKLFNSDSMCSGKATLADNQSSSFKQVQEASGKVPSEQAYVTDSDIDAAKIAAMKAAELVNKNLVGTGYMFTDRKNNLLWGNKNTTMEESVYHWDTTTYGDWERQEKFNKLMGVKGDTKVQQKQDNHNVEKQREQLQFDLEKQYTAGLRWRDGRTVGLGL
ncbi:unnamed protein product [Fraxinus pennsylvanica]|uniref:Small acidic protein-like domain-containing protein n=1 Tax=Fraxinus pennsylvanica TaxID=56036 RepID=A0AAD2A231_9LAMI|nr:unnamed protein product [Fraxinus pennsylvanica]